MAKDPTTAREAMVAQMMEDFDAIVRRLEQVDADLAAKTSEAVRDAAGKVLLQTQLNFESMMEEQRKSFVRAMTTPCEHGVLDFETCPKCRGWE